MKTKAKSERARVVERMARFCASALGYKYDQESHELQWHWRDEAVARIAELKKAGLLVTLKPRKASK